MSNTSLSDFTNAAAKWMRADRPDLWSSHEEALLDITTAFSELSGYDDEDEAVVHFSGFTLTRIPMDGMVEYVLSRKLISFAVYTEDEESDTFDWTHLGKLVGTVELNLPEYEELDIEPNIADDYFYEDPDDIDD